MHLRFGAHARVFAGVEDLPHGLADGQDTAGQRMIEDMRIRNFTEQTQTSYCQYVSQFAGISADRQSNYPVSTSAAPGRGPAVDGLRSHGGGTPSRARKSQETPRRVKAVVATHFAYPSPIFSHERTLAEKRQISLMETFVADLKYAVRTMRRNIGVTGIALAAIAI